MSRLKKYNAATGQWKYADAAGEDASFVNYDSTDIYPSDSIGKAVQDLEADVDAQSSQISALQTAEGQTRNMISDAWIQKTYAVGEYAIYNNKLWRCKVANSSAPSEGANWTEVSVTDELYDSGWIDITSYINTAYFGFREGQPPKYRIKNGIVYFKGEIYCHTNPPTANSYIILNTLPADINPGVQISGPGVHFGAFNSYMIYITAGRTVRVAQSNMAATSSTNGYTLTCIPPYIKEN